MRQVANNPTVQAVVVAVVVAVAWVVAIEMTAPGRRPAILQAGPQVLHTGR